jgi:hypothetical protein
MNLLLLLLLLLLLYRGNICHLRKYIKLSLDRIRFTTHSLSTATQTDYLQLLKYKFTARDVVSRVSVNYCR